MDQAKVEAIAKFDSPAEAPFAKRQKKGKNLLACALIEKTLYKISKKTIFMKEAVTTAEAYEQNQEQLDEAIEDLNVTPPKKN